jgi:plasmid maintenance system antidote protein VapI
MTQTELARRTGTRKETVSRMVTGRRTVSPKFVVAFLREFGYETGQRVFPELSND